MVAPRLAQVAVRMVVVVVVAVVVQRLVGLRGHRGRAVRVLAVVVVVLAVRVAVSARVPGQLLAVVRDPRRVRVMVLLAVAVVAAAAAAVVVMRAPVALEGALLLQLLLDVRRRGVAVSRGSDQGLHRVLRGQA